jgi:hypothetical protein
MNQGTQGYGLMKKTEGRKSHETIPLSIYKATQYQIKQAQQNSTAQ